MKFKYVFQIHQILTSSRPATVSPPDTTSTITNPSTLRPPPYPHRKINIYIQHGQGHINWQQGRWVQRVWRPFHKMAISCSIKMGSRWRHDLLPLPWKQQVCSYVQFTMTYGCRYCLMFNYAEIKGADIANYNNWINCNQYYFIWFM